MIAILGGTGPFGRALAKRFVAAGIGTAVGSRSAERARAVGFGARGMTNADAARAGDPVFLAVPFSAQDALLAEVGPLLEGKLVIACGVIWPPGSRPETSAAEEAARLLPESRVAAAFQTVAAAELAEGGAEADALVFADREADRVEAARIAAAAGLRALPVGPLRLVRAAEASLGILLRLNRSGIARRAGLRITGLK